MKSWFKAFNKIPLTLWQKNNSLGQCGEELACRYLKKQGYEIVAQRFRTRFGEIDIIANKKHTLSFIEVKTRRSSRFGTPLMAITPGKLLRLLKASQIYLYSLGDRAFLYQTEFLGIGIQLANQTYQLECVLLVGDEGNSF